MRGSHDAGEGLGFIRSQFRSCDRHTHCRVIFVGRLGITAAAVGVFAAFLVQAVVMHARAARLVKLPSLVILLPVWLAIGAAVTGVAVLPDGPWWIVRAAIGTSSMALLFRLARMMRRKAATATLHKPTTVVAVAAPTEVGVAA